MSGMSQELKDTLDKIKETALTPQEEMQHHTALRHFLADLPDTQRVWSRGRVCDVKNVPAFLIYDQVTGEIQAYTATGTDFTVLPRNPRRFFADTPWASIAKSVLQPETTAVIVKGH